MLADVVGNNHHGEERDEGGEYQAVDENYQAGLAEILQLGALDFAVHLRERFFAAHGQHGMTESDEDGDDAEDQKSTAVGQPAQGARAEPEISRMRTRR